jgi:acyl carrier protein
MTDEQLLQVVRQTLAAYTEIPAEKIKPSVGFADLGIDSLTAVSVVADLEGALGVTIPNDEALDVKTVGDVVERLRNRLGGSASGAPVAA